MSSNIAIDPVLPALAPLPFKAEAATPSASPVVTDSPKSPNLPNPKFTVDPGLNRVVLEYFASDGLLTNMYPSQKQLDAYRLAASSGQASGNTDNTRG